jgi:signal transduction histidine kinase
VSIGTRIALTAAAAVLAAVAMFGVGAYYLISERAYDRVDRSLERTADRVAQGLGAAEPEPGPEGTRVEVDPLGRRPPSGPRTVTLAGERFRLLVRALPAGADGGRRTVAVARPLTDVEQTLDEVALGLSIAALAAAALATGLALIVVRGALRPLTQARRAAERVADSQDPSLRVPEGREDEVGGLARAMNRMLARLEDAQGRLRSTLSEQRRFAADASHEMRTPLTALRGDIETLRTHDPPPADRAAALGDMSASVDRMDRLVEGLLGLARVDGDGAAAELVDLGEVVGEIASEEECEQVGAGVVVSGDRAALRGMLHNLIDNGRRHGGRVSVAVLAEDGEAVVRVADDGPGVAEDDRERVFDRFYRAPSHRGTPGAGLGLAIARATAERWGGSVRLVPSAAGARFEVRLPLVSRRAAPGSTRAWPP